MFLQTQRYQQVHTGDCCGTRARNHHPHVGDVFLHHAQAVEDGGSADNCRAVLIVVEYRNIHPLAQFLFNIETFWRFNVFEVDAAEGRFERSDDFNKFVRSSSSTSMSNTSIPANFLNRTPLPSITGLPASAPMLPNPSTAVPLEITATRLPRAVYL